MAANILIVDRDLSTFQALQPLLCQEGYAVDYLCPGPLALQRVADDPPGLVLLGIDGDAGGWRFCHRLLCVLSAPLLLLLASEREPDRVRGLSLGAGDCLSKGTAGPAELLARIGALLRRQACRAAAPPGPPARFVDGDLVVDLARTGAEVSLAGRPVPLTPIELRLLACLLQHPGRDVPVRELLRQAWGAEHGRTAASLWPHLHNLRAKLEPGPGRPRRLVTRRGLGYRWQRIAAD